jgi:hypothetical protein
MITVRRSTDRGHFDHGWLNTYHTFSFSRYYDPRYVGYRALRVLNEDWVQPGQGFGMHPHDNMEIITYVLEGALQHQDTMGNGSVIHAGEFQRITAGTGMSHSEFNPSSTEPVHLVQIWLLPEQGGLTPSYEQRAFPDGNGFTDHHLRLVASRDGRESSLTMHQSADLYLGRLESGERAPHTFQPGRHGWLQVLRGTVRTLDETLHAGDGAAISGEPQLEIEAPEGAEFLLFDLK